MEPASASILASVEQVLGKAEQPIALHEPLFAGNEKKYVSDCIDTGWVSSVGSYVDKFEFELAKTCGVKYAVAAVNGTAALHMALELAGVGEDDEVLMPALTFIASANAVSYCCAVPHFVDSSEATLGLDPEKLDKHLAKITEIKNGKLYNKETSRRIAAILPVHIFGHPVDMDPLQAVANKYNLPIVEDAAESLGSSYHNKPMGSFGKLASLSFNGNKIITTGGGGAILTNDESLAKHAKHLTTVAKRPHKWAFDHDEIGYNYRLPNINAALGCAQLEQLDGFVAAKRALAASYEKAFSNNSDCAFFKEQSFVKSNYWLNAILLNNADKRDIVLQTLNETGYQCRPAWTLMHKLPMYKDSPRADLSTAENLEARIINLPSSAKLGMVR